MRSGLRAFVCLFLIVTLPAEADAANRFLKKARKAYDALRYEKVVPLLNRALKVAENDGQKEEIYTLLAQMHVMYNRTSQAIKAFIQLLKINPGFELPDTESPKVLDILDEARQALEKKRSKEPVVVVAEEPAEEIPSPPVEKAAESIDASPTGAPPEEETKIAATAPMDPSVTAVDDSAFYETWWFWTAVGVVVATGAGATIFIATQAPDPPNGDFGLYRLP